jgi:YD repeat-containing protein
MALYRLWEPQLTSPLDHHSSPDRIRIRSDTYGQGTFGAKRRGARRHAGIDLLASLGSMVRAARSGWATTDYRRDGYGHLVIIQHPDGSETRYAHLARVDIANGQWVWQGQPIGTVGKTGNAGHYRGILPHLHFEVRLEGAVVDPMPLLIANDVPSWRLAARAPASAPAHIRDANR